MTITDDIITSITHNNLVWFKTLVNHPALLINDIFDDGLLHFLINYKEPLSIDWFLILTDNINVDLNKLDKNGNPPILARDLPDDVLELLGRDLRTNIFLEFVNGNVLTEIVKTHPKALKYVTKHVKFNKSLLYCEDDNNLLQIAIDANLESLSILLNLLDNFDNLNNPHVYAFKKGNVEAFKLLLSKGFSLNTYINDDNTLADFIILGDNREFINILMDNLDKVTHKDRLLLFALTTNKLDIIDDLIHAGCVLSKSNFARLSRNEKLMLSVIKNPKLVKQTEFILSTNNINMVTAILNEPSIDFKNVSWYNVLVKSKLNKLVLILTHLLENNASKEDFENILFTNDSYNFKRLMKEDTTDIISKILAKYPDLNVPRNDFPSIDTLVTNKEFDMALKLIKQFKITLNKRQVHILIHNRQKTILEDLFKNSLDNRLIILSHISDAFGEADDLLILFELFKDDKFIIQTLFNEFDNNGNPIAGILPIMDKPELMLDVLDCLDSEYDIYGTLTTEEADYNAFSDIINIFNSEELERLLSICKKSNDFKSYDLITSAIELESQVFFDLIMKDESLYKNMEKKDFYDYFSINPIFTVENIDDILKLPNITINMNIEFFNELINLYKEESILYKSSKIIYKLFFHNNFNPNKRMKIKDGKFTILHTIIGLILNSEPNILSADIEEYLKIASLLLANPLTDVNIGVSITPSGYLLEELDEFIPGKKYDGYVNYNAGCILFNKIINHPSFDINRNSDILYACVNNNFLELLTLLVSKIDLDINHSFLLHYACKEKNFKILEFLLTIDNLDLNVKEDELTPLHFCIHEDFLEGALLLLKDPRLDLTKLDSKGRNYIRLANKHNMKPLAVELSKLGLVDEKEERVNREVAEYDEKMKQLGRKKEGRIRETLNSFDLILKERETNEDDYEDDERHNLTQYNLSVCPFCLTYLEKDNSFDCVYLSGHVCPEEIQNEDLKRLYFGDNWATKVFEVCCTCGRPCSHHGHYKPIALGSNETSSILRNDNLANHWKCNEHNGGGGKLEMIVRLTGILTELKKRVDNDVRLVYNPELIKELCAIANNSLFDPNIKHRAITVFEKKKWNVNSKIAKYVRFNAPNVNNTKKGVEEEREEIEHVSNLERDEKIQCMICLDDEPEDVFKPHASDKGYICGDCLKGLVCSSKYESVTCELGCKPKKQIHKKDVNNLLEGNYCE